ncbi:MAG: CRISPR-associated endonuclease Cas2 [Dehalococcoidia bacterium]
MATRDWWLVSYDVRDDRRLRETARLLEGYGERVQYSVFRCQLTRTEIARLRWELEKLLEDVDDLLVIPLCSRCARSVSDSKSRTWGGQPPPYRLV